MTDKLDNMAPDPWRRGFVIGALLGLGFHLLIAIAIAAVWAASGCTS